MKNEEYNYDFDSFFEKAFSKFTKGIEDHNFRHFNHSLNCMIYSKEHLKSEMKRRRMVPYDAALEIAHDWDKQNQNKEYKISKKTEEIIRSVKMSADRYGNIRLGNRALKALAEEGLIQKRLDKNRLSISSGGFYTN